ncbi:MAG: T9SS type A sorting domain-containing protein [Bacteroidetes bacterium]|nr:MAG: T9SS type A sorting domain-containing protein [Bacteroidota bacterium]
MIRSVFLGLTICSCALLGRTQFLFDYSPEIPVLKGTDTLHLAWSGGLNYAQLSQIDFDFDGDMDLFVFDRSQNNVRLFEAVQSGGTYRYKAFPHARTLFPPEVSSRVALLDYDGDGRNDLFTHSNSGIMVFRNVGSAQQGLQWELVNPLIYSTNNEGDPGHLFVSASDIPAYVDVEGDGDIDVLTYHIGGAHVEYHQNQSMDLYGHADSLIFELRNECWGKFTEDASSAAILLNDPSAPCTNSVIENPEFVLETGGGKEKTSEKLKKDRHAGSTLLALDIDHSGVLDLLIGDVSINSLILLKNGGAQPNTNSAMVSMENNFPSGDQPISVATFPAAYYLDVDFDGKRDLIAAANAKNASNNRESISFYRNMGTDELPDFKFQTSAFLQEEMIDVGSGAVPVLIDLNGDGLEDLLVANLYVTDDQGERSGAWQYYVAQEINGKRVYVWVSDDYAGLSQKGFGLRFIPGFSDLDGDGDEDMVIGLENGSISYVRNIAVSGVAPLWEMPKHYMTDVKEDTIDVGSFAHPQLFDLNRDGLADLIVGSKSGELRYYENVGTLDSARFELKNELLGGIDLSPGNNDGYSAPHFFRYEDTTRLLLGGFHGQLNYYTEIDGNLSTGKSFDLVSAEFRQINVEAFSSAFVADLDDDGLLNLLVGGDLGGVLLFEHNENSTLSLEIREKERAHFCYPNPTNGLLSFRQDFEQARYELQLFNALGSSLELRETLKGIDLTHLPEGLYFIRITDRQTGQSHTDRVFRKSE